MDTKNTHDQITTAELRLAFRRVGLWRFGWSFEKAMAVPVVLWGLQKSALAGRRQGHQVQLRLI
jgi:hypothetical protein